MEKIKDVKPKEIVPGVSGFYVHGDKHTFGYVALKQGSIVPEHNHIHEQITYVLKGQLDMVIDGVSYSLKDRMYHIIHSNVLHSAVAVTDCLVIDTFSPVREEYKNPSFTEMSPK